MAKLKLLNTIFSKLGSLSKNDGQIVVTRDSKSLYIDLEGERIEITDWIDIDNEESLLAILSPLTNKYYYTKDTNKIWRYVGSEWICLNNNINEMMPTYIESTTLTKLKSGEKISVAFGKISKAVTDLISHIGDSIKHITSEERTNWDSAKTHADSVHARTDATKVEKSTTNGNIKINGNETIVYTHPSGTNPHGTTKSDIGLGNVGNFKAVSTVANQGLTDTEKSNARTNIGAGTSSFSGSYNDLSNKPTIPTVGNGTVTIKQAGTSKGTFTMNQSGDTTIELTDNNTTYGVATQSANGLESAADKKKLDGIATGAEVNQNAFSNVVVGSTTISADSKTDSLTLAGSNVTITPDADNDKVTIGITKANVTSALGYTPPTTNTTYGVATSSALGLVKSGTDITVDSSGNVSVNDDSHNHVISNIDGLQTALDGKAASSHTHNYLPLSGGVLTGEVIAPAFKTTNSKVNIWEDGEGGNIEITSNDNVPWQIDAYNGNFRIFAKGTDDVYKILTFNREGSLNIPKNFSTGGQLVSTSANAFRAIYSNYGFFIRNDGGNTYFMLTNSGDQYGSWNSLRPMIINNASGNVSFAHDRVKIEHSTGNITAPRLIGKADSLQGQSIESAPYVTDDTHILQLGYWNCTGYWDRATLLISSAFWGNQHGSGDIIHISQDTNTDSAKTVQCSLARTKLHVKGTEREFYYKIDNTNKRIYLYVKVFGGNSYGKWSICPILFEGGTWVTEAKSNQPTTGLVSISQNYASASHTHNYLPLSGGTVTGQIKKDGISSGWVNGRNTAIVRMSSIDGYSPFASIKTTNGSWEIGAYKAGTWDDSLLFTYITDSDYNASNNRKEAQIRFYHNGVIEGRAKLIGSYTSNVSSRYGYGGLEIRESNSVGNTQSDIGYAPSIGFHWSQRCAGTLCLDKDAIFHFLRQDGTRATLDANINGNISGNATTATKLENYRTIFGLPFNGTSNLEGKAVVFGTYISDATNRFQNSGIEIRENNRVADTQTDIGYAPSIGFNWAGMASGTLCLDKDGIFHFLKTNGTRATIDANINGNINGYTWSPETEIPHVSGNTSFKILALDGTRVKHHRIPEYVIGSYSDSTFYKVTNVLTFKDTNNALITGDKGNFIWSVSSWSDRKLKKNIKDADISALDKINQIQFKEFDFIDDKKFGKHQELGYIADELKEVFPECVVTVPQDKEKFGYEELDQVQDVGMIKYLAKAIQELTGIIQEQNDKIDKLQKEVDKLKRKN